MARQARVDIENHWYHVISRGQRRNPLFFSNQDRETYLKILDESLKRNNADVGAYCLMTNHVHLLIYRRDRSLGQIFRQANMLYASYFNRKHGTVGYLFQGRFKSYLVLNDSYLISLIRYIHMNPVNAGMVKRPNQYKWSSDWFYRGQSRPTELGLTRVPGFEERESRKRYIELIKSGVETDLVPTFEQYIGERDEVAGMERRKRQASSRAGSERRHNRISANGRFDELLKDQKLKRSDLIGPSRKHDISHERQRIISQLYSEGYLPTDIASIFKRTPAAVILAYRRYTKLKK